MEGVSKREERFITAARHQKEPLLNRKLERFVPEKLEETLNLAFYKAFELIFNRGTSIIEKTYRKEDMENTYKNQCLRRRTEGKQKDYEGIFQGSRQE